MEFEDADMQSSWTNNHFINQTCTGAWIRNEKKHDLDIIQNNQILQIWLNIKIYDFSMKAISQLLFTIYLIVVTWLAIRMYSTTLHFFWWLKCTIILALIVIVCIYYNINVKLCFCWADRSTISGKFSIHSEQIFGDLAKGCYNP